MKLAILTLVAISLTACRSERPPGLCVEAVCFALPLDTSVRHDGRRHTLRPRDSTGWINVQRISPELDMPADLSQVMGLLSERFLLDQRYRVISSSVQLLHEVEVVIHDLEIRRLPGTDSHSMLRRRHILLRVPATRDWIGIDVTARVEHFDSAIAELFPIVERVTIRANGAQSL